MGGEFLEFWEVFFGAGVAQGDADVSDETVVFDAFDGGFSEGAAEVIDGHVEEFGEGMGENFFAGVEGGFAGDLGEAVPRAGVEAVITAVDAVADGASEFKGDGAFVLDGEVGDAAGGDHFARSGDGLGGTGGDAGGAFAAVVL